MLLNDIGLVNGVKTSNEVCVYICDAWCCGKYTLFTTYDHMIIRCHPFYLLREFTAILPVTVLPVTPPPTARRGIICSVNCIKPSVSHFNQADCKTVLPKFYHHVDFPTRKSTILMLTLHFVCGLHNAQQNIQGLIPPTYQTL